MHAGWWFCRLAQVFLSLKTTCKNGFRTGVMGMSARDHSKCYLKRLKVLGSRMTAIAARWQNHPECDPLRCFPGKRFAGCLACCKRNIGWKMSQRISINFTWQQGPANLFVFFHFRSAYSVLGLFLMSTRVSIVCLVISCGSFLWNSVERCWEPRLSRTAAMLPAALPGPTVLKATAMTQGHRVPKFAETELWP